MPRRAGSPSLRTPREAWRALLRRPEVRASRDAARELGIEALAVGGAVRDAFLRRPHKDLDLTVDVGLGRALAEAIGRRLGARAVEIGAPGRKIARVPFRLREVDVWEAEDREQDLLRRDFRVNAMAFELTTGALAAPPGALQDLASRRLAPPRPGVFVEDPLRVLRAARLERSLGFRVAASALPELHRAAALLPSTAAERRLAELDLVLANEPRSAAAALRRLEGWGALAALAPGSTDAQRAAGVRLVARAPSPSPLLARLLFLTPLGAPRALALLESWKVPRLELRAARTLLSLPVARRGGDPSRREVVLFLRAAAPFDREAIGYLLAAGDAGSRRLAAGAASLGRSRAATRRLLAPARPLTTGEIAALARLEEGPALGALLVKLDVALAAREVRGRAAARRWLRQEQS